MPSANLLAAVRAYVRALDSDRAALSAAIEGKHPLGWRPALASARDLTHAELELRAAAAEEERAATKRTGICPYIGTDRRCDAACASTGYGTKGPCAISK